MMYIQMILKILCYVHLGIIIFYFGLSMMEFMSSFQKPMTPKIFAIEFLNALWLFFVNAFIPIVLFFVFLAVKIFVSSGFVFSFFSAMVCIVFFVCIIRLLIKIREYSYDDSLLISYYYWDGIVLIIIMIGMLALKKYFF